MVTVRSGHAAWADPAASVMTTRVLRAIALNIMPLPYHQSQCWHACASRHASCQVSSDSLAITAAARGWVNRRVAAQSCAARDAGHLHELHVEHAGHCL